MKKILKLSAITFLISILLIGPGIFNSTKEKVCVCTCLIPVTFTTREGEVETTTNTNKEEMQLLLDSNGCDAISNGKCYSKKGELGRMWGCENIIRTVPWWKFNSGTYLTNLIGIQILLLLFIIVFYIRRDFTKNGDS